MRESNQRSRKIFTSSEDEDEKSAASKQRPTPVTTKPTAVLKTRRTGEPDKSGMAVKPRYSSSACLSQENTLDMRNERLLNVLK